MRIRRGPTPVFKPQQGAVSRPAAACLVHVEGLHAGFPYRLVEVFKMTVSCAETKTMKLRRASGLKRENKEN